MYGDGSFAKNLSLVYPDLDRAASHCYSSSRDVFKPQDRVVDTHGIFFVHCHCTDPDGLSVKLIVAPLSGSASAHTRPPCRATIRFTLARPIPVPSNSFAECSRWNTLKSLSAYLMSKPAPLSRTNRISCPFSSPALPTSISAGSR